MKHRILLLLFFSITNLAQAATIYVNVHNVNGNLVQGAYVKLYDSDWGLIKSGYTNSSGMVTFALLDYGIYNYEVYYSGDTLEFWGSEENINLQNPTLTSNFTRYWPYRYGYDLPPSSVYTNNPVTYEITVRNKVSFSRNVKVELWVDKDQSSSWDYHQISSAQSISSNGTRTYTFTFTPTISGTYYWKMHVLSYNDGAGDYIVTDSYFWDTAFTANDQVCDLDIYVKNVNGNYIENAYVKLYDENWDLEDDDYTNSSGRADFNNLDYGIYRYEVFYTGDTLEFWGSEENINLQNPTLTSNFTRYWPYRYGYDLPPSSVYTNNPVTYEITVKNKVSFSRDVKVEIWVDRDQSSSWDFHQTSSSQSISSNGTKTYTFTFTPTIPGTYYWKMHVLSYNDGAGDYIVTDSYFWANSFEAVNEYLFPLTDGILIYHSYSNYYAWDSKLFTYDFATNTKTEISANWNIDNEMNAHFSPDGSRIVFMGVDSDLTRNWDVYLWDFGTSHPINLTSKYSNTCDEDPKFSPDGSKIVFKQDKDIKIMDLNGNIIDTLTNDGEVTEESMPYYTTDGQKVVYAKGAKANSDIYIIDTDGSNSTALYSEIGIAEYYPIVKDDTLFFYAKDIIILSDTINQIYLANFSGSSTWLSINDSISDNSDAYPVGSDYLFFSSTRDGSIGKYDLYLGQISTGDVWSLNVFNINDSTEDLGACYVSHQIFNISASSVPSVGGGVNGLGSYNYGEICDLTATPATGYNFINWTEDGVQVSINQNYSFAVTSNRTLVANFSNKDYVILVSANLIDGGSISGSGGYDNGDSCNVTAEPATGYNFINWTEDGVQVSENQNYNFTVTSNRTLVANFENTGDGVEVNDDTNINVYPNPSTGKVTIRGNNIKVIRVININGQIIKQIRSETNETIIDLNNIGKGIYFIKVISKDKVFTKKIIIIK